MTEELYLVARGQRVSGWTDIEVELQCEGFPNTFAIGLTTRDPAIKGAVLAAAGDDCQIYLGEDLVITGHIDRDIPHGDRASHTLQLVGRGNCADLVDCSAEFPTGLINGDALTICTKLAAAYGITCALGNGAAAGPEVVGWALNYTEPGDAIVQRVAQNAGLLAYEDAQGRLLLASVGTMSATGGVVYGQNVEAYSITSAMDQRYSEVVCCSFDTASAGDLSGSDFYHTEPDPNVLRHRRLDIVTVGVAEPAHEFTIRRAKWEIARRAGRGTVVQATVDSWRDSGGTLWTPNTLVPVTLPGLRVADPTLCLSSVTFRRDNEGTHADLVLMPREAFTIEPVNLVPVAAADIITPDGQQ